MTLFSKIILTIILCFHFLSGYTTEHLHPVIVRGIICDERMTPLSGAYVIVRTVDSTLLNHTVTDSLGHYQISISSDQKIIIESRFMGYEPYFSCPLSPMERILNICLSEKRHVADEVVIKGKIPLLRIRDGNFIVNTAQIANADNLTLESLLNRLPGVSTQNGLTLNGRGAILYIDGVKQQIGAKNVLYALPGAVVQEIELLAMPTAEWGVTSEAIINIRTKKRHLDGYYLTLSSGADIHRQGDWSNSNNVFLVFKKKNMTFNSMLSFESTYDDYGTNDSTWYANGIVQDRMYDFSERLNAVSFLGNLNWISQSGHSLNFNAYVYDDHSRSRADRRIGELYANRYVQNMFSTKTQGDDDLWSAKLEYKSPDSLKTKVTVSYGIVYGGQHSGNDYLSIRKYMDSKLDMTGHMHTVKGMFQHNPGKGDKLSLYSGFNATFGKLNDKTIYQLSAYVPENKSYSTFTGIEDALDLYLQMKYKIAEKWSILGHFTATYTNYNLHLESESIRAKSIYWKYFPYLTFSFSSSSYKSTVGYTTSMTRPNYEWLLPGMRYNDSYSYSVGNPDLSPTIQKSVVWNNLLFHYMTIYLSYTHVSDAMGKVMTQQEGEKTVYSFMNYADFNRYNFYVSIPYELFHERLSGEIATGYTYNRLKRSKNGFVAPGGRNTERFWQAKWDMTYTFTNTFQVNSYWGYTSPQKTFQSTREYRLYFGLGASYSCLKNQMLTFSMQLYDILDKGKNNNNCTNYFDDNYQRVYWRYSSRPRTFNFSVRLKLNGGESMKDKAKGIQNDLNRFEKK